MTNAVWFITSGVKFGRALTRQFKFEKPGGQSPGFLPLPSDIKFDNKFDNEFVRVNPMCAIKGCNEKPFARGLCAKHYMRLKRHGDVEAVGKRGRPAQPFDNAGVRAADVTEKRGPKRQEGSGKAEEELILARKEIERLRKELSAQGRLPKTVGELMARRRSYEAEKKKAKAARADAPVTCPEEERTLREQLEHERRLRKGDQTRIRNLTARVNRQQAAMNAKPVMSKWLHRQVLGFLHPDRAPKEDALRKRLERCYQEFSVVKFTLLDDD